MDSALGGDALQSLDILLKAQAAGVDLSGVFDAHIPPVPGLVDDLGLVLGVLGVAEDEAVVARVLTEPAEGGGLLEALVQTGVLRAVQVGGEAAVVLGVSRRVDDGSGLFLGGGVVVALVEVVLVFRS